MRPPRVRFTVRRMMVAVAALAMLMAVWAAWFDPVRRWQRAVNDDQDGAARWQALDQMVRRDAKVDRTTALATLADALRSPSPRVRETALAGLGRLGPEARPAASSMMATLADPRPHIRALAVDQLGRVFLPGDPGREDALPTLIRMLDDRSPDVRLHVASALTEFGHGEEALPVLIEALRRPDYLSQAEALWSIGRIGPRAGDALGEVVALESRAGESVAPDLSRHLRVYAARTRYMLGDRGAGLMSLRALAAGPDDELARDARETLSRLSDGGQNESK